MYELSTSRTHVQHEAAPLSACDLADASSTVRYHGLSSRNDFKILEDVVATDFSVTVEHIVLVLVSHVPLGRRVIRSLGDTFSTAR